MSKRNDPNKTAPPLEPLPDGLDMHSPLMQVLVSVLDKLQSRHSYQVHGIEHIPKGRCLIVVNHSLATYDVMLLMLTILNDWAGSPAAWVTDASSSCLAYLSSFRLLVAF